MTVEPYAIVATSTGTVENIIVWDGATAYIPGTGLEAIAIPSGQTVAIGYTYANSAFTAPTVTTPTLTAAQIAAAAYAALIAGGITITSSGTPALNGVYAIDAQSQMDIATEAQFISTFQEFTNGATTNLQWPQANGTFVEFPATTEFLAFAKAAAQLVAAAKLALAQTAAMPSAAATIS